MIVLSGGRAVRCRRRATRAKLGEHGQSLILFVAIFSVILAMGAFALDQGLAYGRHGQAQNRADAASRAGAYACVLALSEGASVSDACDGTPEAAAVSNAVANGAVAAEVTPTPSGDCPAIDSDMPSMSVIVERQSPSLFLRAFGRGGFTASAKATTCMGAVTKIRSGAIDAIPAWFTLPPTNGSDPNAGYCGDPPGNDGYTTAGEVCVIFSTDGSNLRSAGLFTRGAGNTACGPGNVSSIYNQVTNGLGSYTCATDDRIHNEATVDDTSVLDAFQARLDAADDCSTSLTTQTAFADTMRALGADARQGPDFTFAGSSNVNADDDWTVYQQRGCFSPRLALVPLVDQTNSSNKRIVGFTAVYILGCYPSADPRSATTTMNDCSIAHRGLTEDCGGFNQPPCDDTEVRVGIVRTFLAGESVQEIGPIDTTGGNGWIGRVTSLSIQTTE